MNKNIFMKGVSILAAVALVVSTCFISEITWAEGEGTEAAGDTQSTVTYNCGEVLEHLNDSAYIIVHKHVDKYCRKNGEENGELICPIQGTNVQETAPDGVHIHTDTDDCFNYIAVSYGDADAEVVTENSDTENNTNTNTNTGTENNTNTNTGTENNTNTDTENNTNTGTENNTKTGDDGISVHSDDGEDNTTALEPGTYTKTDSEGITTKTIVESVEIDGEWTTQTVYTEVIYPVTTMTLSENDIAEIVNQAKNINDGQSTVIGPIETISNDNQTKTEVTTVYTKNGDTITKTVTTTTTQEGGKKVTVSTQTATVKLGETTTSVTKSPTVTRELTDEEVEELEKAAANLHDGESITTITGSKEEGKETVTVIKKTVVDNTTTITQTITEITYVNGIAVKESASTATVTTTTAKPTIIYEKTTDHEGYHKHDGSCYQDGSLICKVTEQTQYTEGSNTYTILWHDHDDSCFAVNTTDTTQTELISIDELDKMIKSEMIQIINGENVKNLSDQSRESNYTNYTNWYLYTIFDELQKDNSIKVLTYNYNVSEENLISYVTDLKNTLDDYQTKLYEKFDSFETQDEIDEYMSQLKSAVTDETTARTKLKELYGLQTLEEDNGTSEDTTVDATVFRFYLSWFVDNVEFTIDTNAIYDDSVYIGITGKGLYNDVIGDSGKGRVSADELWVIKQSDYELSKSAEERKQKSEVAYCFNATDRYPYNGFDGNYSNSSAKVSPTVRVKYTRYNDVSEQLFSQKASENQKANLKNNVIMVG